MTWFQRYAANPITRSAADFLPGMAVIETRGRSSGLPRRVPVGGRLEGPSFWLVSEQGRRAGYVRNIEADPGCASGSEADGMTAPPIRCRTTTSGSG